MRFWGPNILIDGTLMRTNVTDLPFRNGPPPKTANPADAIDANVIPNNPDAAAQYEFQTQEILRTIEGNPVGKILLDAFTGERHSVTIRPMTVEVGLAISAQAEQEDDTGAQNGAGSEVTIWYDKKFLNAITPSAHDPDHHVGRDDALFHECVHAMRMIRGVWKPIAMPSWGNREELYAVALTNIYLAREGRSRDMRGDHANILHLLDESLRWGASEKTHDREGEAFFRTYRTEFNEFRNDTSNIYFPIARLPLGWNPLRECEDAFNAANRFSPGVLELGPGQDQSGKGWIPMENPFGGWTPH